MDGALWAEIRRLSKYEKLSKRGMASRLHCSVKTVTKALAMEQPPSSPRLVRPSRLHPYHERIGNLIDLYPDLSAVRIQEEIAKGADGYTGSIFPIRRYLSKIRPYHGRIYQEVMWEPGQAMQVDWGTCGWLQIGEMWRRVYAFVAVLCFSRQCFLKFSLSMASACFYRATCEALHFFGGCPHKIIFDNLKTAVLDGHGRMARLKPSWTALCAHYGIHPIACQRNDPESKGVVEGSVKYVKRNALKGRDEQLKTWAGYQQLARYWRDEVANVRLHDTTRERPCDRFEKEKPHLRPLLDVSFDTDEDRPTVVSTHARVRFDGNSYSVPPAYCRKPVALKANDDAVWVLFDGAEVARHTRCYEKRKLCILEEHRIAARQKQHRAQATEIETQFDRLGPDARTFHAKLLTAPVRTSSHLRKIMKLVHVYGRHQLMLAIRSALEQELYDAAAVENLLYQHRRRQNLPSVVCPQPKRRELIENIDLPPADLGIYDRLFGLHTGVADEEAEPSETT